jgi:hypothetical protein
MYISPFFLDAFSTNNSIKWVLQNKIQESNSNKLDTPGKNLHASPSVQLHTSSTHGLYCKERSYEPQYLKHWQSDNTTSPADVIVQQSNTIFSNPPAENITTTSPGNSTFISAAAFNSKLGSAMNSMHKDAQNDSFIASSSQHTVHVQNYNKSGTNKSNISSTQAEDELFNLLTRNVNDIQFR